MAGWHHWLDGRDSEWTPGGGDGQAGLACCDSWRCKESDTTERLNWTELNFFQSNEGWNHKIGYLKNETAFHITTHVLAESSPPPSMGVVDSILNWMKVCTEWILRSLQILRCCYWHEQLPKLEKAAYRKCWFGLFSRYFAELGFSWLISLLGKGLAPGSSCHLAWAHFRAIVWLLHGPVIKEWLLPSEPTLQEAKARDTALQLPTNAGWCLQLSALKRVKRFLPGPVSVWSGNSEPCQLRISTLS